MLIYMSLSDGWLRPYHELLYVILFIIAWLQPYHGFAMILYVGWLRSCLGSNYMIILWMDASIPRFMYYLDSFSDVYVSMLACKFSDDGSWFPASTCKEFYPTLVRPSCFRGHLLHRILSLSQYSLSMILEDLYSVPNMLSHHEETPSMSLFMSRIIPLCIISQESSFYPSLQDQLLTSFLLVPIYKG